MVERGERNRERGFAVGGARLVARVPHTRLVFAVSETETIARPVVLAPPVVAMEERERSGLCVWVWEGRGVNRREEEVSQWAGPS